MGLAGEPVTGQEHVYPVPQTCRSRLGSQTGDTTKRNFPQRWVRELCRQPASGSARLQPPWGLPRPRAAVAGRKGASPRELVGVTKGAFPPAQRFTQSMKLDGELGRPVLEHGTMLGPPTEAERAEERARKELARKVCGLAGDQPTAPLHCRLPSH